MTGNMNSLLASFRGRDLPTSLWRPHVLHLPATLAAAHKCFLEEKGWWADYAPRSDGGIGGRSAEEARGHVINRFLNSAARMQFVCSDPRDEQTEIRDMVLDQLADGHIHLLDLAAGNGAGTLAMLAMLCELRAAGAIPKLPINVAITGVDHSADALAHYADLLGKLTPWLENFGLHVDLKLALCDLTVPGEFSENLEGFFDDAKRQGVSRFLCVISALSGAKMEGVEQMLDSLKNAAARLSHTRRNSSWLWVEPNVGKSWFTSFADTIRLTMRKIRHRLLPKTGSFEIRTEVPVMPAPVSRRFDWHDPHIGATTPSHVVVAAFRNQ